MADIPIPVMATRSSSRSAPEHGPNPAAVVLGGCLVVRQGGVRFVNWGEEGDPDVVAGFEAGCHPHADPGLVGGDVDQVGDEADPGVFLEGDGSDDKRRGKPGIPLMMVDGDAHDDSPTGDIPPPDLVGPAVAAHWYGRMQKCPAGLAGRDPQHAVAARLPKRPGLVIYQRQRTFRNRHAHLPQSCRPVNAASRGRPASRNASR